MAEIDIQKKEGPSPWVWIVGILALLLVVGLIWALTQGGDRDDRGVMPADTVRDTLPATWDTVPAAGDPWDTVPPAGDTLPSGDDTWDTIPPAGDPGAFRGGAAGEHVRLGFLSERTAAGMGA